MLFLLFSLTAAQTILSTCETGATIHQLGNGLAGGFIMSPPTAASECIYRISAFNRPSQCSNCIGNFSKLSPPTPNPYLFNVSFFLDENYSPVNGHLVAARNTNPIFVVSGTVTQLSSTPTFVAEFRWIPSPSASPNERFQFYITQANVNGDPHFTGLSGQKFKFEGEPNKFYNIFTSPLTQINTYLIQSEGINEFTVNGEIGIRVGSDTVYVSRKGRVRVNNIRVPHQQDRFYFANNTAYIERDNGLSVQGGPKIVTQDVSLQLALRGYEIDIASFTLLTESKNIHGLLGQTWDDSKWPQDKKTEITDQSELFSILEGEAGDYEVKDGLFGTDFAFNRFECKECAKPAIPPFSEYWKIRR